MGKINDEEFIKVYEENKTSVFRIAFSYIRVWEDAENIMQDTFLKLYTDPPKDKSNLVYWLARVTRNLCLDFLRAKKREEKAISEFEKNNFKKEIKSVEFDILPFISKLPENYSSVIRLHYYGGLSIKDIAITLKTSESNVKKGLARAREKLKNMIEEEQHE
jgi:RNA polymerase sigma-70 factor (ECF subfamily)